MTNDVRQSIDRIHAALTRIEAIAGAESDDNVRHRRLRVQTEAALIELDQIIGRLEAPEEN